MFRIYYRPNSVTTIVTLNTNYDKLRSAYSIVAKKLTDRINVSMSSYLRWETKKKPFSLFKQNKYILSIGT